VEAEKPRNRQVVDSTDTLQQALHVFHLPVLGDPLFQLQPYNYASAEAAEYSHNMVAAMAAVFTRAISQPMNLSII
jgi:hypothetical protein